MYISSFHIDGFGHFSHVNVDNLPPGMVIFLGGNEAGKSTCLEFLRMMLTGERRKKDWSRYAPLAGGQPGGSLVLQCQGSNGAEEEIRLSRAPGASGLSLYSPDGRPLPEEMLDRLLAGVNAEVYRKIFGFSLGELEKFGSLSADEVRNALYGASFGPGLASPGEVLSILQKRKGEIFKSGGSNPVLNMELAELESLRAKIADLASASAAYESLDMELRSKKEKRDKMREERNRLESEKRGLEKRLAAWRQWDQWRLLKKSLEDLPAEIASFPEDAETRLARLQEARDACERQLISQKLKARRLREKCGNLDLNEESLAALPELRRLAERKNSYRLALGQLSGLKENCQRARDDLASGLAQLGPGWDCERIRSTDRSLFARQDLEKQANEMNGAIAAQKAAIDYLDKINREVESCGAEVSRAQAALDNLPEPAAVLNDQERDQLRQNMARLEESRRLEPGRERALEAAKNAFSRACGQTGLGISLEDAENREEADEARKTLDAILASQKDSLALAEDIRKRIEAEAEEAGKVRQAEANAEGIKHRMDELLARRRADQGPRRDTLEARTVALRNLRSISASISAEKERLGELDAQINGMEPPARVGSWALLVFGVVFLLLAAAIFVAHWLWALTEINIGQDITVPVNVWAGYGALLCGVAFMAGAMPGNGQEQKRRAREMAQLQSRRETSAMRLAELGAQAQRFCASAGVDSMDAITLDATEMLLEREKEQCFHEERTRREMESLKHEYATAQEQRQKARDRERAAEGEVRQCRMHWHNLMQGLGLNVVPSPESADTFYARIESARLAWDNVANARGELDALWEDLHLLEETISQMPPIAERLADSPQTLSLEKAAKLTLDSCRDADLAREERMRAQSALRNLQNELARARARQEEAAKQQEAALARETEARAAWEKCMAGFGFGEKLDPETVRQAFKFMENCLAAEERFLRSSREMEQSAGELAALESPLAEILEKMGKSPLVNSDNEPDWLATLDSLLADAEKNDQLQKEKERLSAACAEAAEEAGNGEAALANANAKLSALLSQAACENEEDFLKLVRRHKERMDLAARISALETDLRAAAQDQPLAEFLASFTAAGQEEQETRLSAINGRLDEIRDGESDLLNSIGALSARVETLSNSEDLANLRQEEAMLRESMLENAMKWSAYAVAEAILKQAKSIFEKERQPEVIRMASEIFARVTDGRWSGLSASLEDKSLLILSPNGEPVSPEKLSRGAREQAYLALRLAYIYNHSQRAAPLPVIMDEILVNFDPERAERTADLLAKLAEGTNNREQQLLYFTCQPSVAKMLRKAAPKAPLYLVENRTIARSA